jgi:beta-N-acetylhexosaminidase
MLPREDVRQCAGGRMMFGFEGTCVTAELRELLRETSAAGVILFARNVESPEQVRELCAEIHGMRRPAPRIAVDQEGGRVLRIAATPWPCMRALGECDDIVFTRTVGLAMGRELAAMHVDIDFAPVLDVNTNPRNPIIGDRAFSDEPETVARHAVAWWQGLEAAGVRGCGKHFPGHGDTAADSHLDLPVVEYGLERLRRVDWPPFVAAIGAGIGAIMTAHVVVDGLSDAPGTLSCEALAALRGELGFGGVIISDDIEMRALADRYSVRQIAAGGLVAGVDLFLACKAPEVVLELYRSLVQCGEERVIPHQDLRAGARRVVAWKGLAAPRPALECVGSEEHKQLAFQAVDLAAHRLERADR